MKKTVSILLATLCCAYALSAQSVGEAKFHLGDEIAWSKPAFDDSAWQTLSLEKDWCAQGIVTGEDAYAWYRIHITIPSSLKKAHPEGITLNLGPIDDEDVTYINGHLVGQTTDKYLASIGEKEGWEYPRRYFVPSRYIKWDSDNVIAVRVFSGYEPGGFYAGPVTVDGPITSDLVTLRCSHEGQECKAVLSSALKTTGTAKIEVVDVSSEQVILCEERQVRIPAGKSTTISWPVQGLNRVTVTYSDSKYSGSVSSRYTDKYILTPEAPATPRYNGPLVFGVRPGSPVIFRLAFSGEKPMRYEVEGLPEGVTLDVDKGVLSGSCSVEGDYPLTFKATNAAGSTSASFTLKVGQKIALTPPMGWNSWNCWGLSVSQEKVITSANALISRGLADYGYSYINIDDAWESETRNADGTIGTNEKFPDMRAMGDYLHGNGLKMGIYSSPGDRTCGEFLGSIDHEQQDAEVWNYWGVDYLKYDWCGYRKVFDAQPDRSTAAYARPYMKMQEFLRAQPRDIFYSLCQYGFNDVWKWGPFVDANSWRTTGDITDTWESLRSIGFDASVDLYPYAAPGHWNDPDMLIVGKVGWSADLRDSRLTPDEQYTHISLWSLLAANMLIGCDIAQIDDFTFGLLCNNEVNAVNQDVLGVQAHRDSVLGDIQVWSRPLADGSIAVGIFNLGIESQNVNIAETLSAIGYPKIKTVHDLWRQKDIDAITYSIAPHGVRYFKFQPVAR